MSTASTVWNCEFSLKVELFHANVTISYWKVFALNCQDALLIFSLNSRESLNVGSSTDAKARPLGSPRLGIASLTKTSDYR